MQAKKIVFTLTSRGEQRDQEQSTVSCRLCQVARRLQRGLVCEKVCEFADVFLRKRRRSAKRGGLCQDLALGGNEGGLEKSCLSLLA